MKILDTAKSMFNGVISKIIVKAIKKHLDIDAEVGINSIGISELDNMVTIHFDGDIMLSKETILELIKRLGL